MTVAAQLDLGLDAPWHLLLLIEDGQIGLVLALLWCVLIGGLIACVGAAAARGPQVGADRPGKAPAFAAPRGYAGPGSLGGTPSSSAAASERLRAKARAPPAPI